MNKGRLDSIDERWKIFLHEGAPEYRQRSRESEQRHTCNVCFEVSRGHCSFDTSINLLNVKSLIRYLVGFQEGKRWKHDQDRETKTLWCTLQSLQVRIIVGVFHWQNPCALFLYTRGQWSSGEMRDDETNWRWTTCEIGWNDIASTRNALFGRFKR